MTAARPFLGSIATLNRSSRLRVPGAQPVPWVQIRCFEQRGIRSAGHHKCRQIKFGNDQGKSPTGSPGNVSAAVRHKAKATCWADLVAPQQLARWLVFDQRLGWALALRKAWRGRRRKQKAHFYSGTIPYPSQSNPSVETDNKWPKGCACHGKVNNL